MQTKELSADLDDVERRLHPRLVREAALEDLNDLFRSGRPPDPPPTGFLAGALVATTVTRPLDALARKLKDVYMPWLGKSFDRDKHEGVNVLKANALKPMKLLRPSYEPESQHGERVEAFPFRTRLAPGAIDESVQVLKIDYDFDANPSFLIRHVLDELVQIDDDLYLGKILYRMRNATSAIGFFSLRSETAA